MNTPVAIYARHSTDRQTESTKDQITRCEEYCRVRGYDVTYIYSDEAISGASMINRPGIQDLLDGAFAGLFAKVITEDMSRLSRDQGDIANLYKKLAWLDVGMETVQEGEVNELHIGLKGTMNALYLKDLADKTKRGQIAAVLKGRIQGGRLYGYDTEHRIGPDGKAYRGFRTINAHETEVVREIFRRYLAGETLYRICARLNEEEEPSPFGSIWRPSSLVGTEERNAGLIRQTLYKGEYLYNKIRYVKDPETGKRQARTNPRKEWIMVPVPELAIIDADLYERAQQEIKDRQRDRRAVKFVNAATDNALRKEQHRQHLRRAKKRYREKVPRQTKLSIFSGKLHCVLHKRDRITKVGLNNYRCGAPECRHYKVRQVPLEEAVFSTMKQLTEGMINAAMASFKDERQDLEKQFEEKKAGRDGLRPKVERLIDVIEAKTPLHEIHEIIEPLERQAAMLNYEMEKIQERWQPIKDLEPGEAAKIHDLYHEAIQAAQKAPFDQPAITRVFPWFSSFYIDSTSNEDGSLNLSCPNIVYDWRKMFTDLRQNSLHR